MAVGGVMTPVQRHEWLAGLKIGDAVKLVTPCGVHRATVEDIRDDRMWVLWSHGETLGHSATWVYVASGSQRSYDVMIQPVEAP